MRVSMILRQSISVGLLAIFVIGCAAPTSLDDVSVAASIATPMPLSTCDIVDRLAPDRPPIPRPTFIPIPTITPIPALASSRSDLLDARFYSRLLGKEMPVLVYLPPGYYESSQHYPVLYLLSGFAGDYREWATYGLCEILDALIRGGTIQPMIVVMPEGERSWWFNHAPVPGSDGKPYGDYVWRDVVDLADATFRTLPRRESRAIGGLSAGGQSALMLAVTQPEIFSIVGAHSPSLRGADGSIPYFGDPEYFKQYDPVWLLKNTDTWRRLSIWLDMGRDDTQWGDAIRELHRLMDGLGIPHEFQDTVPGKHESDYWSARLSDYLGWYSTQLAGE